MVLIEPLWEGPIDVVGDIHGESGPLFQLLDSMGYDGNGVHPEGRRLVFVGDFVDRGPDSITVLLFIMQLVRCGRAQAVLGNHELNLLRGSRKHGNAWFWGETESITKEPKVGPSAVSFQRLADGEFREQALSFLKTLPVALERHDVRVVHACWHAESIERMRACTAQDALSALELFDEELRPLLTAETDEVERDLLKQNRNPVRVLTSGLEQRSSAPFYAGGRLRAISRRAWWEDYGDRELAVFGHFWRAFPRPATCAPALASFDPTGGGERLFGGREAPAPLGRAGTAVCVDFSVGLRYEERGKRLPPGTLGCHLVALRLPERELLREDGHALPLEPPAPAPAPAPA